MATWQATNILTNAVEGAKYVEVGTVLAIWKVALTTALANGDTILGPQIPANTYLETVTLDTDDLDGGAAITLKAGYAGNLAAFIADGNTIAQTGGRTAANVAGTTGFTASTNTQLLVTITHAASPPIAGTMRLLIAYTASP